MITKVELTKEVYLHKISTNDAWLIKAILVVYSGQTEQEQNSQVTLEENGMGFTGADAQILSSFANQIQRRIDDYKRAPNFNSEWNPNAKISRLLSAKQKAIAITKMAKYYKQIIKSIKVKG